MQRYGHNYNRLDNNQHQSIATEGPSTLSILITSSIIGCALLLAVLLAYAISSSKAMDNEIRELNSIKQWLVNNPPNGGKDVVCECVFNTTDICAGEGSEGSDFTPTEIGDIYEQCYDAISQVIKTYPLHVNATAVSCTSVPCTPVECTALDCFSVPCTPVACTFSDDSKLASQISSNISSSIAASIPQLSNSLIVSITEQMQTIAMQIENRINSMALNISNLFSAEFNQLQIQRVVNASLAPLIKYMNDTLSDIRGGVCGTSSPPSPYDCNNVTYLASMECVVVPSHTNDSRRASAYGYACEISYGSSVMDGGRDLVTTINKTIGFLENGNCSSCCSPCHPTYSPTHTPTPTPCPLDEDEGGEENVDDPIRRNAAEQRSNLSPHNPDTLAKLHTIARYDPNTGPIGPPVGIPASASAVLILLAGSANALHTVTLMCDFQSIDCFNYLVESHPLVFDHIANVVSNVAYVVRPLRMLDFATSGIESPGSITPFSKESLLLGVGAKCAYQVGQFSVFINSYIDSTTDENMEPTKINKGFWTMDEVSTMVPGSDEYVMCVSHFSYSQQVHSDTLVSVLSNGMKVSTSWALFVDGFALCAPEYSYDSDIIIDLINSVLASNLANDIDNMFNTWTCSIPSLP